MIRRVGFALAVSTVTSLGACAPDEESLIVRYAPQWPLKDEAFQCRVDGTQTVVRGGGILDLTFRGAYTQPFLLENNLTAGGGPTSGNNGVDDSEIELQAASVRLEIPQDPRVIELVAAQDPNLVEFRFAVQSISISGGGKQGLAVQVIPAPTAAAFADVIPRLHPTDVSLTVLVHTVFHANRGSNSSFNDNADRPNALNVLEVDAREFTYPIDLCFGCLRDCPPNLDPGSDLIASGGLCGAAQDQPAIPVGCLLPAEPDRESAD
ncbi:MAG: hypothetical protein B7733_21135 [Myxococcales bacterium FL481]|nr:MAG: hypothetical protein B7733_21135 [Myxococcales bacterium FL481]